MVQWLSICHLVQGTWLQSLRETKIPRAAGQLLSPHTTTREAHVLHRGKPAHLNKDPAQPKKTTQKAQSRKHSGWA